MRTRLPTLRPRDLALFVAVAVVVAVVVVAVGRELGIGSQAAATLDEPHQAVESAEAPDQAESTLTLTLQADPYCETERAREYFGDEFVFDDEGEAVGTRTVSRGWDGIAEIPVQWQVSGGVGPYTLVVDGEPRDGKGPYVGATGTASVSCAVTAATVFYTPNHERRFRGDPEVDSGAKTIRAVVTDATGATAGASIDIYVILQAYDSGTPLTAGETYRLNGTLFTIPDGVEAKIGSGEDPYGGETIFNIVLYLAGYRAIAGFGENSGTEIGNRRIEQLSSGNTALHGQKEQDEPEAALASLMDDLVESTGQAPAVRAP